MNVIDARMRFTPSRISVLVNTAMTAMLSGEKRLGAE
jgi:hypothetical protein